MAAKGKTDWMLVAIVGVGAVGAASFIGLKLYLDHIKSLQAFERAKNTPAPKTTPLSDCVRWGSSTTTAPWASIDAATLREVEEWRTRAAAQGRQTTVPKCGGAYGAFA